MLTGYPSIVKVLNPLMPDGKRQEMVPFPLLPNYHPSHIKDLSSPRFFHSIISAARRIGQVRNILPRTPYNSIANAQLEYGLRKFFPKCKMWVCASPHKVGLISNTNRKFTLFEKGDILWYLKGTNSIFPNGEPAPCNGLLVDVKPSGTYRPGEEFGCLLEFDKDQGDVDMDYIDTATKSIFVYKDFFVPTCDVPSTFYDRMKDRIYDNCCLM